MVVAVVVRLLSFAGCCAARHGAHLVHEEKHTTGRARARVFGRISRVIEIDTQGLLNFFEEELKDSEGNKNRT